MVRQLIPTEPPDRKLSKIETLRLATSYIGHLKCQLMAGDGEEQPCLRLKMGTWQEARMPVCTFCLASQKKLFHRPAAPVSNRNIFPALALPSPSSYYGVSFPYLWGKGNSPSYSVRPLCDLTCRHPNEDNPMWNHCQDFVFDHQNSRTGFSQNNC